MASDDTLRFNPETAVGTTLMVRPGGLNLFHKNPRKGDVDAIAGSLKANGQYTPIIVNIGTHTGRPNEVLAGNHTLKAFRLLAEQNPFELSWQQIKVHVVDVDDDTANRIVLADNRTFEMGEGTDDEIVHELLSAVGTTGTGYTDADLDELDKAFANSAENDEGEQTPPDPDDEPTPPDLPQRDPAIGFTVVFDDEDQQEVWFAWIKQLREAYPDYETVGERLLAHLEDTAGERV